MNRNKVHDVRILCDAPSHAPKIAKVQRARVTTFDNGSLTFMLYGGAVSGKTPLSTVHLDAEDIPVAASHFGTSTEAPDQRSYDVVRNRYALECELCGLRVVLKHITAERLFLGLIEAGVSTVTLPALAATL